MSRFHKIHCWAIWSTPRLVLVTREYFRIVWIQAAICDLEQHNNDCKCGSMPFIASRYNSNSFKLRVLEYYWGLCTGFCTALHKVSTSFVHCTTIQLIRQIYSCVPQTFSHLIRTEFLDIKHVLPEYRASAFAVAIGSLNWCIRGAGSYFYG